MIRTNNEIPEAYHAGTYDIPSDHLVLYVAELFHAECLVTLVKLDVLADVYINRVSNVSQAPRDDLQMIELLSWIEHDQRSILCLIEFFDRVLWLETHLLDEIEAHQAPQAGPSILFHGP